MKADIHSSPTVYISVTNGITEGNGVSSFRNIIIFPHVLLFSMSSFELQLSATVLMVLYFEQ
jgi:hypothetical protein